MSLRGWSDLARQHSSTARKIKHRLGLPAYEAYKRTGQEPFIPELPKAQLSIPGLLDHHSEAIQQHLDDPSVRKLSFFPSFFKSVHSAKSVDELSNSLIDGVRQASDQRAKDHLIAALGTSRESKVASFTPSVPAIAHHPNDPPELADIKNLLNGATPEQLDEKFVHFRVAGVPRIIQDEVVKAIDEAHPYDVASALDLKNNLLFHAERQDDPLRYAQWAVQHHIMSHEFLPEGEDAIIRAHDLFHGLRLLRHERGIQKMSPTEMGEGASGPRPDRHFWISGLYHEEALQLDAHLKDPALGVLGPTHRRMFIRNVQGRDVAHAQELLKSLIKQVRENDRRKPLVNALKVLNTARDRELKEEEARQSSWIAHDATTVGQFALGKPENVETSSFGGVNVVYEGMLNGKKVILKGITGHSMRRNVDSTREHQHERAAFELGNILKEHNPDFELNVPEYAIRPDLDVGDVAAGKIRPKAVSEFVHGMPGDDALAQKTRDSEHYSLGIDDQFDNAAFFDSLIGNSDRHDGNWLLGEDGNLHLIDHGLAFPDSTFPDYGNYAFLDSRRRKGTDKLWGHELQMLLSMKADSQNIRARLTPLLSTEELNGMFARIDFMLQEGRLLNPFTEVGREQAPRTPAAGLPDWMKSGGIIQPTATVNPSSFPF